jgi:PAS domain S-box-containing protein
MNSTLLIGASIVLQLVVAAYVFSQVREVEFRRTWLAIGATLVLMTMVRAVTLLRLLQGTILHPPEFEGELLALDALLLMGIGVAYASRLFRSLKRAHLDLMRSQQSLMDSERRLRVLFDNVPDAILTVDQSGTILNVNHAAEELMGAGKEEIMGQSCYDLPLFTSSPDLLRLKGETPSAPVKWLSVETTFENRSGRSLSVEVGGFDMEIGGEFYRTWMLSDISEKKQLRAETESLESQLHHAERLQTMGTLAGGIAHDFNNILTPIVGYTELAMQESEVDGLSRDHLEHVIQGAMRAKELVKQILAFSRQGTQQRKPLLLQPLIRETLTLIRATLPTTIEIRTTIDPDCGVVLGDPAQIHQVLMNLCTNAFHAMGDSGGVLTIGLCERDRSSTQQNLPDGMHNGPYACLTIQDTGCGMDKTTQERIFEPFFTTKTNGQGSGLGLAVVHGIITAHGGAIMVESQPGQGTAFHIYLPVDLRQKLEHATSEESPVSGTERVLVVDDEPVVAVMISQILHSHGYRPVHRTSSVEAHRAFCANPYNFDIVVTDQTMPHMTGMELAAEVKRIRPEIPVILMTGFSEKISSENFRSFGVDGYLMKPVLANTLTRMIHALTDIARTRAKAHA